MDSPIRNSSSQSDDSPKILENKKLNRSSPNKSPKFFGNRELDSKLPKIPGEMQIDESEGSSTINLSKLHKSILVLFKKTKKKRLEEVDSKLDGLKISRVTRL